MKNSIPPSAASWILALALPLAACTFQVTYPADDAFQKDSVHGDSQIQDLEPEDTSSDISSPDKGADDSADAGDSTLPDVVPPDGVLPDLHDAVQPDAPDSQPEDIVVPDAIEPDTVEPGECQTALDCVKVKPEAKQCRHWLCVGSPRKCVEKPVTLPTTCDDADPCTDNDMCLDGSCAGVDVVCPWDPCKESWCDSNAGGCVSKPLSGPQCDDDDVCTDSSTCVNGFCVADSWQTCFDGDECTSDTCDPLDGCSFPVIPGCGQCYQEGTGYNSAFGGECCTGLEPIPLCSIMADVCPNGNCESACNCSAIEVVCAYCGDSVCGPGENFCNCPDCPKPTSTCASLDGLCMQPPDPPALPCPTGYQISDATGCPGTQVCCVDAPYCVPLHEVGQNDAEAKCCGTLTATPKSQQWVPGGMCNISVTEFVCTNCGDLVCDFPHETPCNCMDCAACNDFTQCPFFQGCENGICTECAAELCGTGFDEDCDGQSDENVCASKECSKVSSSFEPVPFAAVRSMPWFFHNTNIALVGRVVIGTPMCIGFTCTAQLFLEESIGGKPILLAPTAIYPEVQCKQTFLNLSDPFDLTACTPLTPTQVYMVEGKLFDTGDTPKLFLMGFCNSSTSIGNL